MQSESNGLMLILFDMVQVIKKSTEMLFEHKSKMRLLGLVAGAKRGAILAVGVGALVACSDGVAPENKSIQGRIYAESHYVSGFPALTEDGLLNMVVEIPAGTQAKWEANKSEGTIDWEIRDGGYRVVQYLPYPGNYGMVPQTLLPAELGGDGDPLDVLLLGSAVPRGTVLAVRPIGVLHLLDRGEQDDKIIAVPVTGPMSELRSFAELEQGYMSASKIIELWFVSYKGPGKMKSLGYGDRGAAEDMINAAIESYSAAH